MSVHNRFDRLYVENDSNDREEEVVTQNQCKNEAKSRTQQREKTVIGTRFVWKSRAKINNKNTNQNMPYLVVGDSIVRHVKVENGAVKSYSGITATKLKTNLTELGKENLNPRVIFLHAGTNDLDSTRSADDVMGAVRNLIKTAKVSFPRSKIVVNEILQRRYLHQSLTYHANQNIKGYAGKRVAFTWD